MDVQERFPGEGELVNVAKSSECEPARLILRAIRQERDRYVREILAGIETMPEAEIRSKGGKAAGLSDVLRMVELAQNLVRDDEPKGDSNEQEE